ncbi:hypothetical protein [Lacrimispora sp.]|uniref:hypothetical protein n=1 Tax=Lacrimispora sp. TaxID=2719234 RepID=UPI0028993A6A|nr:hypothetical protein [Lacrimispora sp.]
MKATVLGFAKLDFKTPEGTHIQGLNLYLAYSEKNITGEKANRFFISPEIAIPDLKIGESVNVFFSPRGKVEAITK